jgi:1-deoxy-D-xylulose 5-phosphate reductoisomerase
VRFTDILALVESALGAATGAGADSLEGILEAAALAREHVRARIGKVRA